MGVETWQTILFGALIGTVGTGVLMIIRGDFLGRRAAEEVEIRLGSQMKQVEERMLERAERDREVFGNQLSDLKATMSTGFSEVKTELRRLGERIS